MNDRGIDPKVDHRKRFTSTYWLLDYVIDQHPPWWKKLLTVTVLGLILLSGVCDRGPVFLIFFGATYVGVAAWWWVWTAKRSSEGRRNSQHGRPNSQSAGSEFDRKEVRDD